MRRFTYIYYSKLGPSTSQEVYSKRLSYALSNSAEEAEFQVSTKTK